jgi:hypothetical protein
MFLGSGLAMILFTCMIGQLNSQVTASLCIDYINNYFAVFTLWVGMRSILRPVAFFVPHPDAWRSLPVRQLNPMRHHALEPSFFYLRCLGRSPSSDFPSL